MAIKHQSQSYKNKGDIQYVFWLDYPSKILADIQIDNFRRDGLRAFKENHKEYSRVFVECLKSKERGYYETF